MSSSTQPHLEHSGLICFDNLLAHLHVDSALRRSLQAKVWTRGAIVVVRQT